MSPRDIKVIVSRFFREDNVKQQSSRDDLITGYMKIKLGVTNMPVELCGDTDELVANQEQISESESCNEESKNETPQPAEVSERNEKEQRKVSKLAPEDAILRIQSRSRGILLRGEIAFQQRNEQMFIRMRPRGNEANTASKSILDDEYMRKKLHQKENAEDFVNSLDSLRISLHEEIGFEVKERLKEERTKWITDQLTKNGSVPENLDKFYKQDQIEQEEKTAAEPQKKKSGKDGKKSKSGDGKKGKKSKGPVEVEVEEPPLGEQLKTTKAFKKEITQFETVWKNRIECSEIQSQKYDAELAKDSIILAQAEEEVRIHVDEMLILNLSKMKASQSSGKKSKAKKGKKGKKSKKKGKKEKPLPGSKISDLKNMDTDQMLSILIENELINNASEVKIRDIVGVSDTIANLDDQARSSENERWMPKNPSISQLKSIIADYCIFPLGSSTIKKSVHEIHNVKSIMIYGPSGSGKTMMAELIATELGALFINLSPERLNGKFEGKVGATKLVHMAFTVAKNPRYAPVVIYLDNCEEFFQSTKKKKKNPVDKNGPVRFQKDFITYKNQCLTLDDRVIIIGTSRNPEKADKKCLKGRTGFFDRFVYFPCPHYHERVTLWQHFIVQCIEQTGIKHLKQATPCLDFGSLAMVSEGFSSGMMKKSVQTLFNANQFFQKRRLGWLSEEALVKVLITNYIVTEDDNARFFDFTCQITDLDSRRKLLCGDKNDGGKNTQKPKKGKKS
mmetsp:Transcript_8487/g.10710  ORF Transcript_8487/g.10710 Transcript_8487/m.10710 type:complete len:735 (+) Transcript_8487:481-2685(+)